MKKKINITMQVTYEVTKEVEVDSEVVESLEYAQENYLSGMTCSDADMDDEATKAFEWIVDNCHEDDCASWEVEIQDLIVEEEK